MGPHERAGAARGARRARRRGAPRGRERRPALDSPKAKQAIRDSRVTGTRHLVEGLRGASPARARSLSASAIGYYGAHGEEPLDEDAPARARLPGARCARTGSTRPSRRRSSGVRVVQVRTGVVLDRDGGALGEDAAAVPARRRRPGGRRAPVHILDPQRRSDRHHPRRDRGRALERPDQRDGPRAGAATATSPEALGSALGRPSWLPVPGAALRPLYGEMAEIVTTRRARRAGQAAGARLRVPPPRSWPRRCSSALAPADRRPPRAALRPAPARAAGARGAVLGLDDHPAGALAQQVCGGRADPLLAGGGVDRRPVDHVGAHPFGFLDERRARVARADQAGVDLDAPARRALMRALSSTERPWASSSSSPPRATAGWAPAGRRSRRRRRPRRSASPRAREPRR